MKSIIKYFTVIIAGIFLVKCANQQSPPGGPKDTEPPEIVGIYPENGTLNFIDDYFEIDFSEYVEKLSLLDALFISPEIQNLSYDWSGTSVKITFDDTLLVNTTYTVSIGSSIKDLNNQNPMTEAMNISFSTGGKIDVGEITGRVYDNDLTGTMIFAYLKVDTFANPLFEKPQNITQVGENGEFKLLGLKDGEYRLFAVKDENGNRLYNIGDEKYGVSSKIINISDSVNFISEINFKLTREDTIAPFISNVTMTDKHHISVEYSELLDSAKLNASNFYIVDTVSNKNFDVKYIYQGNRKKFEYFLSITDTLNIKGNNILIADSIYDKYNNLATYDSYDFVVNEKPDTLFPVIKSISSSFGKNKIDFLKPIFTINFNDGVDAKQLNSAIVLDKYDWKLSRQDDASFDVEILETLEVNEKIEFSINRKILSDAAGNSLDSVQTFKLETLTGREFSGLSGKIYSSDSTSNIIVVIENTQDALLNYTAEVTNENTYKFERVLPGLNTIWTFHDLDKDGNYNFGKISPFELSEEFFVFPDTVNLRPRWPVGDVDLDIN